MSAAPRTVDVGLTASWPSGPPVLSSSAQLLPSSATHLPTATLTPGPLAVVTTCCPALTPACTSPKIGSNSGFRRQSLLSQSLWQAELHYSSSLPLPLLPSSSSPFLFHSRYEVHAVRCRKSTVLGRLAPALSDPGASPRRS